jgi:hypothetical protein
MNSSRTMSTARTTHTHEELDAAADAILVYGMEREIVQEPLVEMALMDSDQAGDSDRAGAGPSPVAVTPAELSTLRMDVGLAVYVGGITNIVGLTVLCVGKILNVGRDHCRRWLRNGRGGT